LYYFNAVQTPALAVANADKGGPGGAGINKYVAPLALLWFRWAALATWVLGAYLLSQTPGRFIGAFTLGLLDTPVSRPNLIMGIGAWFGTIMLFNVWGIIWPNQKKILGMKPASDEEKGQGPQAGAVRLAHQLPAVDSDADVHGRPDARTALLSYGTAPTRPCAPRCPSLRT
jgi:uncharacterized membrane protein